VTNDEIKADILSACATFKSKQYALITERYTMRDEDGCFNGGCALTALAHCNGIRVEGIGEGTVGELVESFAESRYGWRYKQVASFIHGFDGYPSHELTHCDSDAYGIGVAVRAAVLP